MSLDSLYFSSESVQHVWSSNSLRPAYYRLSAAANRIIPKDFGNLSGVQHYQVQAGDTLHSIWKQYSNEVTVGFGAFKALQNLKADASDPLLVGLKAGEKLELTVFNHEIMRLKRCLSDGRAVVVEGNSVKGYKSRILEPRILEKKRVITGTIHSSFAEAAKVSLLPYDIVDAVVDLFGNRIDFSRDLRKGDTFAVKFINRTSDLGGELQPGAVLAASLRINGHHYAAIRTVKADSEVFYVDEEGKALGAYFLRYPVKFSRISSVFSDSRMHPVLKHRRPHYGVDFAAPIGTPVRTIGDGVIVKAGRYGAAGNMVKIQHNSRYSTAYLHLSRIVPGLKPGMKVVRGELIGNVGMTGLASGPHLHFSLYENGRYIDPLKSKLETIPTKVVKISKQLLKKELMELDAYHLQYNNRKGKD